MWTFPIMSAAVNVLVKAIINFVFYSCMFFFIILAIVILYKYLKKRGGKNE